jgi:hypothetical protein
MQRGTYVVENGSELCLILDSLDNGNRGCERDSRVIKIQIPDPGDQEAICGRTLKRAARNRYD